MLNQFGELLLSLTGFVLVAHLILIGWRFLPKTNQTVSNDELPVLRQLIVVAELQFALLVASFVLLIFQFLTHDFSNAYVAQNSSSVLPWYYGVSAVWGGHEGSLLLWVLILGGWHCALVRRGRAQMPSQLLSLVSAVLSALTVGFLSFILFTSNPFAQSESPTPIDGADLNPLLQDFGLIVHPPLLYMGYVGLAVSFGFAIAGLLLGRIDSNWARWTRPWTLVAWAFLTLGIALGSWWAYYELGWGGWWFWDPVENASLMPWLAATGLVHSLAVTDKRGLMKAWTVFLATLAFSLSLLGTFLVRSGVLTSVHAFAADPTRGVFILALLGVVIGGSFTLFALRAHRLAGDGSFALVSRESALIVNNILLVTATFIILLGTLYPLFEELLGSTQSSVGAPYFNSMFVPLGLGTLFVLWIGPYLNWRRHTRGKLTSWLLIAVGVGLVVAAGFGLVADWYWPVVVTVLSAVGLIIMIGLDAKQRLSSQGSAVQRSTLIKRSRLRPSWIGMHLAHAGLAVMAIGIAAVSFYSHEADTLLTKGQNYNFSGYSVRLSELSESIGPNYRAAIATLEFRRPSANPKSAAEFVLRPEKRFYTTRTAVMTEAAIDARWSGDLYAALGEQIQANQWSVRLHTKPLVRWIWLGALMITIGALVACFDKQLRAQGRNTTAPGLSV